MKPELASSHHNGGLVGWLAEMFMKSGTGILMNIVLGIVRAALANFLLGIVGVSLGGWLVPAFLEM
jgi:uncharacterized membrane protein YeaQ/YmgE (transglycosylase-associated protein family)